MSLLRSPAPQPVDVDVDVDMLSADLPSTTPRPTAAHSFSPLPGLSQSPSLPPSDTFTTSSSSSHPQIDSDVSHHPHPFVIDEDARSDTSMPLLYDASDSESGEELFHHHVHDFMSESEVDAHDVEMSLLLDDGHFSDSEGATYLDDDIVPPSAAVAASQGDVNRHVTVEEVEDQDF